MFLHYNNGEEEKLITELANLNEKFAEVLEKLVSDESKYNSAWNNLKKAKYAKNILLKDMNELRVYVDKMELLVGKEFISMPTYEDILYSVKY